MTLNHISFAYGEAPLLRGLTLSLPAQGVTCLVGDSGCGKTTLLRLLCGLEAPQEGTLEGLPRRPAVVFQENRLLPWESALENVALILGSAPDARQRAAAALSKVGLTAEEQARLPHALSGGQCRRVALARALVLTEAIPPTETTVPTKAIASTEASAPTVADALLLDEPFTGLDEDCIDTVAALIRQAAQHIPVLVITHNEQDAPLLSATLLRMKHGKIE